MWLLHFTLPLYVSGSGVNQLLGARVLPSGSGQNTAAEVLHCVEEWGCADDIAAECSDTPTGNTGYNNGAAGLIEKGLQRELIFLACRHHILELIMKGLFDKMVEISTSPDIGVLFKRLQDKWDSMDHSNFKPATEDTACIAFLADRREDIVAYASENLQKPHTRADYRQLLELTLIFLGVNPFQPEGIRFRPPIALSSARFMGRIIYCLTIHIFALTGEFEVEKDILDNIKQINLFFVSTYLKPWYTASRPASAPATDLRLLQDILNYTQCPRVSEIAGAVFKNHLWYLHRTTVGLAFFDEKLPLEEKREMVERLKVPTPKTVSPWKRHVLPARTHLSTLKDVSISHFVNDSTNNFFKIMKMDTSFLQEDPALWPEQTSYQNGLEKVQALQCINDVAERGVALVKRFTGVKDALTKKEECFQDLLVVQNEILLEGKYNSAILTLAHFEK
ncbi:FH1/FH2 domain-containing protein 1 [Frankliniella fusca]|uniref:FH1/FH2 domain-containing protein 1 n=1 Tax=Frankliniella fusca TaxID=407009 RepID=A0AAE1HVW4_9NEOP|nr:FH1/FH2 domain-containing protein 1 [Frankliniella fusca]